MRAFMIAALLAAGPAMSTELVARQGADEIRIYDGPCIHAGTLGLIQPEARGDFHKATGIIGRRMFYGCWRLMPDGQVGILWEDAEETRVPPSMFIPPPTT